MENEIRMIIGSWGSYNACNSRSLGSKWLDLSEYESWEEIEEELKKEGFILNGIDEELFIQDVEGLPSDACSWGYTHPKTLFETLKESEVLDSWRKMETMQAFLEVRNFSDFEELVSSRGSGWDDDIRLYKGYDWADYGREMFDCACYSIPEQLENFIDFEEYGKYMGDYYAEEYSDGIIEIIR